LLVSDYVTPPIAEKLRNQGIEFIDAAGNGFIDTSSRFVWVKGERPKESIGSPRPPTGRTYQPSGLQVVFALLCRPELVESSYREIADKAGVAHGTVGWTLPELQQEGHVVVIDKRRRLAGVRELLQKWVEAYARTLRPKLILGRYRAKRLDWVAKLDVEGYGLSLGGEPAAQHLTSFLQPGSVTFYTEEVPSRFLLENRLLPDKRGNVEFLRRFWSFESESAGLAPPLLVYADLLAIGDARCRETAKRIYDELIVPGFCG